MSKLKSKKIALCAVKTYISIDKIELHPENPRTISVDRMRDLKRSIIEKGFYEPILVWKQTNYVLSGNHRLKAVRELMREGWEFGSGTTSGKLPVVMIDESDDIAKQILFETNNRYAEWIDEKVREALNDVEGSLKGYGFTEQEIDRYLNDVSREAQESIDAADIYKEGISEDGSVETRKAVGSRELSECDFSNFSHKCPRCGFEFEGPND